MVILCSDDITVNKSLVLFINLYMYAYVPVMVNPWNLEEQREDETATKRLCAKNSVARGRAGNVKFHKFSGTKGALLL